MDYDECRLTIKKNDKGESVVEYVDSFFSSGQGMLQLDPLTQHTVHRFMHWVAKHENNCSRKDLQVLGLYLYRILFDEKLRTIFDQAYEKFLKKKQNNDDLSLRLKLTFTKEFRVLAQYPWEFLFMPSSPQSVEGEFLAKSTEMILTRFLPDKNIDKLFDGESPVRILIVSSHPRRSGGRALDKIEIEEFWDKMEQDTGRLVVKHLENLTHAELRTTIEGHPKSKNGEGNKEAFHPHIFHFIGHDKPGHIALVKDPDELEMEAFREGIDLRDMDDAHWIDGQTLSAQFSRSNPSFIFLNACEGGKSEMDELNNNDIQNLAHDLINAGIPAVVAMQYEINNQDANTFAQKVYQMIHEGLPIDKAVKEGITELGERPSPSWNHRRFGTPVFYLQAEDTTLLPKLETEPSPTVQLKYDVCPHCRIETVRSDWKRCPKCKGPLSACPNCHHPIKPDYSICPKCEYDFEEGININEEHPTKQEAGAVQASHSLQRNETKSDLMTGGRSSVASGRSVSD